MESAIAVVVAIAIGFGLGYWLAHRSAAGIRSDFEDAKAQIKKLTGKA